MLGRMHHPRNSEDATACNYHCDGARQLAAATGCAVFEGESNVHEAEHHKCLADELDSARQQVEKSSQRQLSLLS